MNKRNILITGGCGFIGSHVIRHFVNKYPKYNIINVDKLTYAGSLDNVRDLVDKPNYRFIKEDICNFSEMLYIMNKFKIDGIIHLAAESHVDRSISNPLEFVQTNVIGTVNLLNVANKYWSEIGFDGKLFYHISTDEVYGALDIDVPEGIKHPLNETQTCYGTDFFTEHTRYNPHSPYSASKASSDHFVRAYYDTYGLPTIISNCSNNYGPNQYPEKLIPLFISNILKKKSLPVYGTGENIRDWLYVKDHVNAIDLIFHKGKPGETYNIGGNNEWKNIDLIKLICKTCDKLLGNTEGESEKLITFVQDRAGHDLRYSIDSSKIKTELGWKPDVQFEEGLEETIKWYINEFTN